MGLGLLLDANQIPIGMKMFPGNQSEKPVIRTIIDGLKTRNSVSGRTIQIADKGLNCSENIFHAAKNGDGYIFSKSVKQLPEIERTWVLLPNDYKDVKNEQGYHMGYSTTYSSLIHLKFSLLIYHTFNLSSESTQACISLSKTNWAYFIGLSMARAFNAHCELGVVFNPSSALLQSMRKIILSKVVISILLQYWLYVAYISFIAFLSFHRFYR